MPDTVRGRLDREVAAVQDKLNNTDRAAALLNIARERAANRTEPAEREVQEFRREVAATLEGS